jgi:C4-dicarboxylate transporter DctM subunit
MMEPGLLMFGLFFLMLFIGVPIAVSVGVLSLVFLYAYNLGILVVASNVYANIAKFPLLAIPFFILAGFLMDRVGLSRRLAGLAWSPFPAVCFLEPYPAQVPRTLLPSGP